MKTFLRKNLMRGIAVAVLCAVLGAPPPALAKLDQDSDEVRFKLSDLIGNPTTYDIFDFPKPAVAQLLIAKPFIRKDGFVGINWARVLAQGRMKLPTNTVMRVVLRYDGLEKMESLQQLSKCRVTEFGAASLDFEDRHMKYLKDYRQLIILDFGDTMITDASLPFFAGLPSLGALRLIKTNVTGEHFDVLSKCKYLTEMKLEGANLKPGALPRLKPLLPTLRVLSISRTSISKDDLNALKYLRDIKQLNISTNKNVDNNTIKMLSQCKSLHSLVLDDTSTNDKCLPDLLKMPNLRSVIVRSKTFFTSKNHKMTYGKIVFSDCLDLSNAPPDVFEPLH